MQRSSLGIILAAGEGTRMKSAKAKVLHPVAGMPMLAHVIGATRGAEVDAIALVVGHGGETVLKAAGDVVGDSQAFTQHDRLGTAHAVLAARDAIAHGYDDIIVLFGDTPLLRPDSIARARAALADSAAVAVIGFRTDRPAGYGRLIEQDGELVAIREEKDASEAERRITFCNSGIMALSGGKALDWLEAIGNDNAKGEYYLTDIVGIARADGGKVVAIEADAEEALGVNTRAQLAEVEALWQRRRRLELMDDGVTMIAPETVFLAYDTVIEADVVIEPNVIFGPGSTVRSGAMIHGFSHIEGATVGESAIVGPFARLRPGANLGERAKVGNFCEVKKAAIGPGAKVNHLTYIGDAEIGANVNVGAGAITCNYDGINKHRTEIGPGTFVGSNSALVAPVKIGANAYIASGSVITDSVPDDALALGRARQVNKEGRARTIRERNAALKAKKTSN